MIGSSRLETVFARTFVLHVTHHCRQKTCENDALSHAAVRLRGILVRERSEQLSKHLLQHLAHQISRRHRKHRLNSAANHLDTCVVSASADAGEARNLRGVVSMPLLVETQQRQQQRLAHRMQRLQIGRSNGTVHARGARGGKDLEEGKLRFVLPRHRYNFLTQIIVANLRLLCLLLAFAFALALTLAHLRRVLQSHLVAADQQRQALADDHAELAILRVRHRSQQTLSVLRKGGGRVDGTHAEGDEDAPDVRHVGVVAALQSGVLRLFRSDVTVLRDGKKPI